MRQMSFTVNYGVIKVTIGIYRLQHLSILIVDLPSLVNFFQCSTAAVLHKIVQKKKNTTRKV